MVMHKFLQYQCIKLFFNGVFHGFTGFHPAYTCLEAL
jgi:hypothetical protein